MKTDYKLLIVYACLGAMLMWTIIDRQMVIEDCKNQKQQFIDSLNAMEDQMFDMQYELDVQYDALRRYEDIFYNGEDPTIE